MVGTSGTSGERRSPSTMSGRTVPAAICGSQLPMPKIATGVAPDSMELTESPPPLNGTRTMSAPVLAFHQSMNTESGSDGTV